MVKGKTKSGINFKINEKVKDDPRLLLVMQDLQSDDQALQVKSLKRLLCLLFGGEDGMYSFMDAVASVHDGICEPTALVEELTEIVESLNGKNPNPSSHAKGGEGRIDMRFSGNLRNFRF